MLVPEDRVALIKEDISMGRKERWDDGSTHGYMKNHQATAPSLSLCTKCICQYAARWLLSLCCQIQYITWPTASLYVQPRYDKAALPWSRHDASLSNLTGRDRLVEQPKNQLRKSFSYQNLTISARSGRFLLQPKLRLLPVADWRTLKEDGPRWPSSVWWLALLAE